MKVYTEKYTNKDLLQLLLNVLKKDSLTRVFPQEKSYIFHTVPSYYLTHLILFQISSSQIGKHQRHVQSSLTHNKTGGDTSLVKRISHVIIPCSDEPRASASPQMAEQMCRTAGTATIQNSAPGCWNPLEERWKGWAALSPLLPPPLQRCSSSSNTNKKQFYLLHKRTWWKIINQYYFFLLDHKPKEFKYDVAAVGKL